MNKNTIFAFVIVLAVTVIKMLDINVPFLNPTNDVPAQTTVASNEPSINVKTDSFEDTLFDRNCNLVDLKCESLSIISKNDEGLLLRGDVLYIFKNIKSVKKEYSESFKKIQKDKRDFAIVGGMLANQEFLAKYNLQNKWKKIIVYLFKTEMFEPKLISTFTLEKKKGIKLQASRFVQSEVYINGNIVPLESYFKGILKKK